MLRVRDATPGDAKAIAETNAAGWRLAYRGLVDDRRLDGISIKVWTRDMQGILEQLDERSFSLVAEHEGRFAGSCFVKGPARDGDLDPGAIELVAIYVDPPLWRRGIGTALVQEATQRAKAGGFTEMSLWTLKGNEPAKAFYERLGWRADGATRFDPSARAPALRMLRPLS
jgi:GNAT superfamily N-acetyltransferase